MNIFISGVQFIVRCKMFFFLVDTGANVSMITKEIYESTPEGDRPELQPMAMNITASNGTTIQ